MIANKKVVIAATVAVILIAIFAADAIWFQAMQVKQSVLPSAQVQEQVLKKEQTEALAKVYLETRETYLERAKNGDKSALDDLVALAEAYGDTATHFASSSVYTFTPSDRIWPYASSTKIVFWKSGTARIFDVPGADVFSLAVTPSGELVYEKRFWQYDSDGSGYIVGRLEGIAYRINSDGETHKLFQVQQEFDPLLRTDKLIFFGQRAGEADVIFPVKQDEQLHDYLIIDGSNVQTSGLLSSGYFGHELVEYAKSGDWNTFKFYTKTDYFNSMFSKLQLRPVVKLDDATAKSADCETHFAEYVSDLGKGTKSALAKFEGCIAISYFPFKKFPIPGTTSYYGFMGNNDAPFYYQSGRVSCQRDGSENGCLLYRVDNGVPTVIGETEKLRQKELLKARADGSTLVHRSPYEIDYFQIYEWYDFVNGTTTEQIVTFSGGGDLSGEYESPTLTFYPNGKKFEFTIAPERDSLATSTLSYNGNAIALFRENPTDKFEGLSFPRASELESYVFQSDKTKFYFSVASSSYALDLATDPPRLINR